MLVDNAFVAAAGLLFEKHRCRRNRVPSGLGKAVGLGTCSMYNMLSNTAKR